MQVECCYHLFFLWLIWQVFDKLGQKSSLVNYLNLFNTAESEVVSRLFMPITVCFLVKDESRGGLGWTCGECKGWPTTVACAPLV